jgi:hypothetical protein
MWAGLLTIAAGTAVVALALWVVLNGEAALRLVRRSAPPKPVGPPIEALAADLRRLRTAVQTLAPGTSQVRRAATVAAYDDVLAQTCRALGLADTISDARPGRDRDVERLRTEAMLEAAGLRFMTG